ncbi:type II secretion system F family protein [Candidatus Micrarchaeota archaeon]|nr:type II secretion system F family protein [Candidatus Micrarchaeota archaeon]
MEKSKEIVKGKHGIFHPVAELLTPRFPGLRKKLDFADMDETATAFVEKVIGSTLFVSIALLLVSLLFLVRYLIPLFWIAPLIIVIPFLVFNYLMLYPDAMLVKRTKELDYEIVFAGRHVVIALKSGMPLFETFVGASSGYGEVSREFKKIVDKIMLGVPTTQAIREVTQNNPSKYFVRMMMQIANSVASGADVGSSLEGVLDQISKEQMIQLKEYSQKLTPAVMFYMLFGIIVPSIGVVFAAAVFSFISGGQYGASVLIPVFLLIAIVQFLFLGLIESSRPRYLI